MNLPVNVLTLDRIEVRARLDGMPPEQAEQMVTRCDTLVRTQMRPAYVFRESAVHITDDECDFGFCRVHSRGLASALAGAERAVFFAVTLGIGVDRLLTRLAAASELERYVCDAIASAYAEAAANAAQERLPYATGVRFSPGYGDFPLSFQSTLLPYADAAKQAGITLTDEYLMIPTKSISAVMRIQDDHT